MSLHNPVNLLGGGGVTNVYTILSHYYFCSLAISKLHIVLSAAKNQFNFAMGFRYLFTCSYKTLPAQNQIKTLYHQ